MADEAMFNHRRLSVGCWPNLEGLPDFRARIVLRKRAQPKKRAEDCLLPFKVFAQTRRQTDAGASEDVTDGSARRVDRHLRPAHHLKGPSIFFVAEHERPSSRVSLIAFTHTHIYLKIFASWNLTPNRPLVVVGAHDCSVAAELKQERLRSVIDTHI
jgi:hypothetical protein